MASKGSAAQTEQKNRLEEEIRLSSQKLKDAYDKKDELQNEIIGLSGAWEEYHQAQSDLASIRQMLSSRARLPGEGRSDAGKSTTGLMQQLQEEAGRLQGLQLKVIETQEQLDGLVEQVKHAGQIYEMITDHKLEASAALDKLEAAVKGALLYAIERTARENELVRLKASVAALKIEKKRLESEAAPAQREAMRRQRFSLRPRPRQRWDHTSSDQNQLLDRQLTELSELFKDRAQSRDRSQTTWKKSQEIQPRSRG